MSGLSTPLQGSRYTRYNRAVNWRLPLWAVLTLALSLAVCYRPANAQVVFGSIVGNVTDASGGSHCRRNRQNHPDTDERYSRCRRPMTSAPTQSPP